MKKQELVFVVCRVLSIYILVRAYELLQGVVVMLFDSTNIPYYYMVAAIVWFLSLAAAGWLLWKHSEWFSKKILNGKNGNGSNVNLNISADDLLNTAIIIIGIWILALSVPKSLNVLMKAFYFRERYVSVGGYIVENFSCFAELIIGSLMVLFPNMVSGYVKMIRSSGKP